MPDHRHHRGPHPQDTELFSEAYQASLREAVVHYSWLLTRGYADAAALKLVGDHFSLTARQRQALQRASCSDAALGRREARRRAASQIAGRPIHVDGFNVLITIEAALSGGLVLVGRDGACRDVASVHGTYRAVRETEASLRLLVSALEALEPDGVKVLLDAPISNSGRLAGLLRDAAASVAWSVELVPSPDAILKSVRGVTVASSDGIIMQECEGWFDTPRWVMEYHGISAWLLDLRHAAQSIHSVSAD